MKTSLVTLSLLLIAFPLAFSNRPERVVDTDNNPLLPGRQYYIVQAKTRPYGGGVRLINTTRTRCPVTAAQDYNDLNRGNPVRFSVSRALDATEIYEGTPLDIDFTTKPDCAGNSKWMVFYDNEIQKRCVGIGGQRDHPDQNINTVGKFIIHKYTYGYKLAFCDNIWSRFCTDIERYDYGEGARRLVLTEGHGVPFDVLFMKVNVPPREGEWSVV